MISVFGINSRKKMIWMMIAFMLLVSLGVLASCSGSAENNAEDPSANDDTSWMDYTRLSNEETEEFIKREDVVVIDVRKPEQYEKGHLRGAINIYYDSFMNGRIEELPDLDQPILVYCDYGGLSGIVGDELVAQGYTEVYDFNGLDYWDGEVITGTDPG